MREVINDKSAKKNLGSLLSTKGRKNLFEVNKNQSIVGGPSQLECYSPMISREKKNEDILRGGGT